MFLNIKTGSFSKFSLQMLGEHRRIANSKHLGLLDLSTVIPTIMLNQPVYQQKDESMITDDGVEA